MTFLYKNGKLQLSTLPYSHIPYVAISSISALTSTGTLYAKEQRTRKLEAKCVGPGGKFVLRRVLGEHVSVTE